MAKVIIKNTMVDPIKMTCDECKSVFSYNYQDIESEKENALFSMFPKYTRFITCPVCKHRIDMDDRPCCSIEKEEEESEG